MFKTEVLFNVLVVYFFFSCELATAQTQDEKIVATTILAEARGEGFTGMKGVACVIRQRVIERKKTAAGICLQRKQFSCWNDDANVERLYRKVTHSTPVEITNFANDLGKILASGQDLDRSLVKCANHYCTLETNPNWAKGMTPVVVINHHKFYKLSVKK